MDIESTEARELNRKVISLFDEVSDLYHHKPKKFKRERKRLIDRLNEINDAISSLSVSEREDIEKSLFMRLTQERLQEDYSSKVQPRITRSFLESSVQAFKDFKDILLDPIRDPEDPLEYKISYIENLIGKYRDTSFFISRRFYGSELKTRFKDLKADMMGGFILEVDPEYSHRYTKIEEKLRNLGLIN